MIAQLRGTLVERADNTVILDVGGVGYAVIVSGKTQTHLGHADPAVTLLTEMVVREDSMTLFGFLEPAERDAFRLLTTVQGVGAKAALAILSVLSPAEISSAIFAGDKAMVAGQMVLGQSLPSGWSMNWRENWQATNPRRRFDIGGTSPVRAMMRRD